LSKIVINKFKKNKIMKLTKINLNELANADLNEREMCRLLGGGTPGCCQCGCHGSSTTNSNDSANDAGGFTSDPGANPCCGTFEPWDNPFPSWICNPQETTRGHY
jgi:natural product precursor